MDASRNTADELAYILYDAGFFPADDGTSSFENEDNIRVMAGDTILGQEIPIFVFGSNNQKQKVNSIFSYIQKRLKVYTED
jgi:hypothetical protein